MFSPVFDWLYEIRNRSREPVVFTSFLVVTYVLTLFVLLPAQLLNFQRFLFALAGPLLFLIWFANFWHLPKTKKGKVGIFLSLNCEDQQEKGRIEKDFVEEVKTILNSADKGEQFQVSVIPTAYTQLIRDLETAQKIRRKIRAHFFVYGDVSRRKVNGNDVHVIRNQQIVVHGSVPTQLSKILSQEMNEIFPRRLLVNVENDLLGFEVASRWFGISIRYIIGVAAFFSADFKFAESLFLSILEIKDPETRANVPRLSQIHSLTAKRLSEIYIVQARILFSQWRDSRNTNIMKSMRDLVEKSCKFRKPKKNSYEIYNLLAIASFVLDRNIQAAKNFLVHCKNSGDATWRFSMAFLEAYIGNLDSSLDIYRRALSKPVVPGVLNEIEEFITWILEVEPGKKQLFFCLGYINQFAKEDFTQASKDWEMFLDWDEGNSQWPTFIEKVKAWKMKCNVASEAA